MLSVSCANNLCLLKNRKASAVNYLYIGTFTCSLVLFSCNVAGLITKFVCGKILVTALIKGRDRCRLLIITVFYIAADFSDECTGHTWSNSVAQGCVSRSLANLPPLAELRL